jgi:D-lactate dehydrogenase
VAPLAWAGADALEILDAASLRAICDEHPLPFEVERQARGASDRAAPRRHRDAGRLDDRRRGDPEGPPACSSRRASRPAPPSATHSGTCAKGLAARTGAMRPTGTAFLSEDIAFPVERLAEAIRDCQGLFERHGVPDTAVFGHAKDGNLHFVLAEDVRSPAAVERYGEFTRSLVELVVEQVRRRDQGRARLGPQHGAVREDGVGRARVRPDGARQAAARPRTAS